MTLPFSLICRKNRANGFGRGGMGRDQMQLPGSPDIAKRTGWTFSDILDLAHMVFIPWRSYGRCLPDTSWYITMKLPIGNMRSMPISRCIQGQIKMATYHPTGAMTYMSVSPISF